MNPGYRNRDSGQIERIDGFAFQRQHAEDAFVNPAQGFLVDETLQRLDAQGEFAHGQRALGGQIPLS